MWLWTGTREVCNWYGRPQGDGRERPSLRALFCLGARERLLCVMGAGRSRAVPPPGETFGTACKEELYEN